jgi:hypothetical protein
MSDGAKISKNFPGQSLKALFFTQKKANNTDTYKLRTGTLNDYSFPLFIFYFCLSVF